MLTVLISQSSRTLTGIQRPSNFFFRSSISTYYRMRNAYMTIKNTVSGFYQIQRINFFASLSMTNEIKRKKVFCNHLKWSQKPLEKGAKVGATKYNSSSTITNNYHVYCFSSLHQYPPVYPLYAAVSGHDLIWKIKNVAFRKFWTKTLVRIIRNSLKFRFYLNG